MIDPDWTTAFIYDFDADLNYVDTAREMNIPIYITPQIYRVGF